MTGMTEIREKAELFEWSLSSEYLHDVFLRGDDSIHVRYRRDGSVESADRYRFFSITDLHQTDSTPEKNKRTAVISWLAEGA